MTVENSKNKSGPFNVTGTSGTYPREFLLLDAAHLRVIRVRGGQETDLTSGVSHTGIGTADGTVTVSSGIQAGDQIYLLRAVPNLQRSDYNAQGRVRTDQVENDFDLTVMQIQDVREVQSRALTLPVSSEVGGEDAMAAALAAPEYAAIAQQAALAARAMQFTSRQALADALTGAAIVSGQLVAVNGVTAIIDPAMTGYASALHDLGVDGVRLAGDVIYARWWTAGVEGDASAAITAANAYANARYGAAGQAVTLVLEGTLYIANQITLGTTGAGAQKAFNIDAKQAIFRVMAGGNLEATGEIEAIRIVNCMRSTLEFAQIQCYHRCGGISLERCINSIFTNVHIEKFFWRGFWIKGARSTPAAPTSAGLIVTGVTGEEWLNGDPEFADGANFVATGILNESHDVRVVMAHVGWCGLPIHNKAGSVEFISCHPYNGNATGVGVRLHPMGFLNEGASGVNLYDMYGDNGYIIDLGGGLRIHGLQILSGGSTMTQPYVRLSREVVLNSEIANCLEQIGYFTGTYPVSMFKGVVNIAALTPDPTVPVHFTPSYEWGNKNETWRQKFTTIASGSTPDITTIKVGSSASQEIVERYIPNRPSQDSGAYTQVRYGPGYVVFQQSTSSGGDVRVSGTQRVGISCPTDGSYPLVFHAGDTDVGRFQQGGVFRPADDNAQSLGVSTYRWSQVYAGTGTINTSDEREKQDIRDLTEAERAVAVRVKSLIRAFRFSDAVALKGGDARVHFGVMAQEVAAAFTAEGLDPMVYGIVCYDAWDDQPATIDSETGEIVEPARTAGDRWGVRYDELLAFMLAVL
ncbi:tail fiber domain-containing protein [Paracoccus methylovorus]|uniref:Tail fiber domain-containing protein n=1 Tax=Paracoccus methylovorus TaxID=2812658 RepID=A0ABX7JP39_9RHOB|nr:tail fiber domain-containing protein [Paracoccus methylovorus]QRZ14739.1 tail fiber domain-containing protein [Paracoccus methylovorus]